MIQLARLKDTTSVHPTLTLLENHMQTKNKIPVR